MTMRNAIGLAAGLVVGALALAAPASAAWWGKTAGTTTTTAGTTNDRYYGYYYRSPPVVYSTPYNYGYYPPPVYYSPSPAPGFSIRSGRSDRHMKDGGQQCPPFFAVFHSTRDFS